MRTRSKGFTLIELMLVVAVIGVLSSLAIPAFQAFLMRSKNAERHVLVDNLYRGLVDAWVDNGYKFPENVPMFGSFINTAMSPPWPPTSAPKRFDRSQWGWDKINFDPQGRVYFSYMLSAWDYPSFNLSMIQIWFYSDLDGDGNFQILLYQWERRPGASDWQPVLVNGEFPYREPWGDTE